MNDDMWPDIHSDPPSSLRSILRKFSRTRHHVTSPGDKEKAREYIKKTFWESGLHVWSEYIETVPVRSWNYCGNIKLRGQHCCTIILWATRDCCTIILWATPDSQNEQMHHSILRWIMHLFTVNNCTHSTMHRARVFQMCISATHDRNDHLDNTAVEKYVHMTWQNEQTHRSVLHL